ncbi:AIDA autotransporter-like protein ShdA [Leclercia adecarboxylata]|uniref:AIDA autotransporter-like protein ShdA n=1 Tax=Leclercia adecarboxylata TaxID=83655 RepID=A0A4U9HI62_9ENTR|nr:AIDA autotransporter-like protein ShdA [Leclercia adecarboxylata]
MLFQPIQLPNTLRLTGTGTEDSNFIGLNEGDGFASLTMLGTDWELTGNVDIIGTDDSIKVDTGKLTFAGNVSNAGNTLIAEGATLQLGTGEKTGTLSGKLTNNGTLEFNQAADFNFATGITGSGTVIKTDAHTLTLTGNNSYTGDTQLNSGTMLVAEGATLGSAGNSATVTIQDGATFASAGTVNNNVNISRRRRSGLMECGSGKYAVQCFYRRYHQRQRHQQRYAANQRSERQCGE